MPGFSDHSVSTELLTWVLLSPNPFVAQLSVGFGRVSIFPAIGDPNGRYLFTPLSDAGKLGLARTSGLRRTFCTCNCRKSLIVAAEGVGLRAICGLTLWGWRGFECPECYCCSYIRNTYRDEREVVVTC